MRVSIGVPAYNAERYLPQTLDSVLSQTFRDWNMVIVNDGSSDTTQAIAEHYAHGDARIRYVTQKNAGMAEARNTAFREMPPSDYVIFLDADDLWDAETLATLVSGLDDFPDAVGIHCTARYINAQSERFRHNELECWCMEPRVGVQSIAHIVGPVPDNQTTLAVLAWFNSIPTCGVVLFRRSTLEKVGPWDQKVAVTADWDMFLRCCAFGSFAFINKPLLSYRKHESGASSNSKRLSHEVNLMWRQIFSGTTFSPEQMRVIRACYHGHRRAARDQFARHAARELRAGNLPTSGKAMVHCVKQAVLCGLRYTP